MIITCPNCQTRYQVAEKAIGSAGRKVMCANCNQAWKAVPEPEPQPEPRPKPKLVPEANKPAADPDDDKLFDPEDEDVLDKIFADEAERTAPKGDYAADADDGDPAGDDDAGIDAPARKSAKKRRSKDNIVAETSRQMAIKLRQSQLARRLPLGRIRRQARYTGLMLLIALVAGGLYFRTEIVRMIPDLAGVYEAVGFDINVVGLEFRNMQTLRALSDGEDTMVVTANIRNVTGQQIRIPPVVVSILNADELVLYQWSALPLTRVIGPGSQVEFETQLTAPPVGASAVKLAFASDSTD